MNVLIRLFRIALVAVMAVSVIGCRKRAGFDIDIDPSLSVHPWTSLEPNNDPYQFQFAIVSDRTGGMRPGIFEDAVRKLNLMQPEFVLSVGDLIRGYETNTPTIIREWEEFDGIVKKLEMPFFYVAGNHDISNGVMARMWKERLGESYYHFVYNDVLFLCLNSEDPPSSHIGEKQLAYIEKTLAENQDVRWTLVFLHKPLWVGQYAGPATNWDQVEAMLKGRRHSVFAGHHHAYMKFSRNGESYIRLGTTGGGSNLAGPDSGRFDQIVWVTMMRDGPRVVNLILDGIWDENVYTPYVAGIVGKLRSGGWITPDPLFVKPGSFEKVTLRIELSNPADIPMMVSGRFIENPDLEATPETIRLSLLPGSTKRVNVEIEPRDSVEMASVEPLELEITAAHKIPNRRGVSARLTKRIGPVPLRDCPRVTKPVTVDGDLKEWARLPHTCGSRLQIQGSTTSWKGPEDASFRFGVAYDDDFVYLGVEVTDDRIISYHPNGKKPPYSYDGLSIRFDARKDPVRSRSRGAFPNRPDTYMGIWTNPGKSDESMTLLPKLDNLPEGSEALCLTSEKGYNFELAIPTAYLDERQNGEWKAFRINLYQVDVDDARAKRQVQAHWRPRWSGPENFSGSGTFVRK